MVVLLDARGPIARGGAIGWRTDWVLNVVISTTLQCGEGVVSVSVSVQCSSSEAKKTGASGGALYVRSTYRSDGRPGCVRDSPRNLVRPPSRVIDVERVTTAASETQLSRGVAATR